MEYRTLRPDEKTWKRNYVQSLSAEFIKNLSDSQAQIRIDRWKQNEQKQQQQTAQPRRGGIPTKVNSDPETEHTRYQTSPKSKKKPSRKTSKKTSKTKSSESEDSENDKSDDNYFSPLPQSKNNIKYKVDTKNYQIKGTNHATKRDVDRKYTFKGFASAARKGGYLLGQKAFAFRGVKLNS